METHIGEFVVKKLGSDMLGDMVELQDKVYDLLIDKSHFVMTTSAEFEESLKWDFCLGAFNEGALAAVTTMIINRSCNRNIGELLGNDPLKCVTYDTTFVHPNFRGKGLQKEFIKIKDAYALNNGADFAFATVSPENVHSRDNLLAVGFEVVEKRVMYEDLERYILRKKLHV